MARDEDAQTDSDRYGGAPAPWESAQLFGHVEAEQVLLDAYRTHRLPNAFVVGGPEGIGKATLAWRFARFVLTNPEPDSDAVQRAASLAVAADHPVARRIVARAHSDLIVLRREYNERTRKFFTDIRVEDVRKMLHRFQQASSAGGFRIAILDSAENLNRASANALLKIVEEPPARSIFLIVAQRPAMLLPTIRSRASLLRLRPLPRGDVGAAVRALGSPWADRPEDAIARAAAHSGGSVRQALRLLEGAALTLLDQTHRLLENLPNIDWKGVHALADHLGDSDTDGFDNVLAAVLDWLNAQVQRGAADGPLARLAPYAEVWEKVVNAARETEALNLDKRPLLLSLFAELAIASAGGPS
jgi:DNA polymerase III subunit delta'